MALDYEDWGAKLLNSHYLLNDKRGSAPMYDNNSVLTNAHFVLIQSLQKLEQAKRSRSGIQLARGLLITCTALKAKQLLLLFTCDNKPSVDVEEVDVDEDEDVGMNSSSPEMNWNQNQSPAHSICYSSFKYLYTNDRTNCCHDSNNLPSDYDQSEKANYATDQPLFPPSPDEYLNNLHEDLFLSCPIQTKRKCIDYAFDQL